MMYRQTFWERTKWARYSFIMGLLIGIIVGWAFHNIVSLALWFVVLAVLLIVAGSLFYGWQRLTARRQRSDVVILEPQDARNDGWRR